MFFFIHNIQNIPSGNYSKHFPVNEWFGKNSLSPLQTISELVLMSWNRSHSEKLLTRVQIPPTVKSPLISPLCGDISCGGFVCLFISPLRRVSFNFICMLGCCSFCVAFNIFRAFGEPEVWRQRRGRLFSLMDMRKEREKLGKINSTSASTGKEMEDFFFPHAFFPGKISKTLYFLLF